VNTVNRGVSEAGRPTKRIKEDLYKSCLQIQYQEVIVAYRDRASNASSTTSFCVGTATTGTATTSSRATKRTEYYD
jgi:hypothetical protein